MQLWMTSSTPWRLTEGFVGFCWACWVGGILECTSGNSHGNVLFSQGQSKVLPSDLCDEQDRSDHHWRTWHYCGGFVNLHCFLVESTCCNKLQHYPQETALFVPIEVPHHVPICAHHEWNLDGLVEMVWRYMSLLRTTHLPFWRHHWWIMDVACG